MIQDLLLTAPFTFLSAMAIIAMVVDALIKNSARITFLFSVITLIVSGILAIGTFGQHGIGFNGMISGGGFSSYFDVLFSVGGLLTILPHAHICKERELSMMNSTRSYSLQ
jgi:NADH:ubiquinone oxidoreductase subunit 2 (subunit N)